MHPWNVSGSLPVKVSSERSVFCILLIACFWYSLPCDVVVPSFIQSGFFRLLLADCFLPVHFHVTSCVRAFAPSCFPSPASDAVRHFNLANHCKYFFRGSYVLHRLYS